MNSPVHSLRMISLLPLVLAIAACNREQPASPEAASPPAAVTAAPATAPAADDFYGTLEPFAANAVYFVVTDRFVNGDEANDHRDQGGAHKTFDIPVTGGPPGETDNIGYLGGDFRGVVDQAPYIAEMGFTAVWVTPIVENPDEAFTGGDPVKWGGVLTDRGKTGYHGYWGTNFYRVDEHLTGEDMDFPAFTAAMKAHGLAVVLDIVANHGSPSFSMPTDQPGFGEIYDRDGKLVADSQNLPPDRLDPANNPLHAFYNKKTDLAQLSDLAEDNPAVLDYLAGAYLGYIDQGAAAFRIDTMALMPTTFWQKFSARIREKHPGFFMFGEAFDYDARNIGKYTQPDSGSMSVLDFPLKAALSKVFGKERGDFSLLAEPLYLDGGPFRNPYELTTFYDNHDMARLDASDEGFIDAHNWLFTARGIPVVYYGSEMGFQRGRAEHAGNRNYFGIDGVRVAEKHHIRQALTRIANARKASPALQRGVQVTIELAGDRAAFYRVYQHDGMHQTALVLLNKGDTPQTFDLGTALEPGRWTSALGDAALDASADSAVAVQVRPHDVKVFLLDAPIRGEHLRTQLSLAMRAYGTPGATAPASP